MDNISTESPLHGSATVRVASSPEEVFALLTDLDRLLGLSPENQRCEFLDDSTAMQLGARFRGHNKAHDYEWHADCEVTERFHAPLLSRPDVYPGKVEGRRDDLQRACETSMANLKTALES